ncbi:twin-arginine translocase TatA/TatE family subunit [Cryobacterium sp. SO2]|uniref:twin-arginine translocase TatA/TatE family subunit n=1 Tax=Cryobacterium sp. SO2 TaxID=1897060 RepID=UPI00223D127A|nr:twin-arginine translocase TatA/TatE family subunit [Cryobacterium sp. SO2]WEO79188.1 twin-arginine translocase TatA/TatE family subunit [Cryobacterium sp. SO2]
MLSNLTGWHFLIILVVILLLFGAPKLPLLARSLGQSMKIFKSEIKSDTVDPPADSTATPARTETTDGTTRPVGPGDQTKP